MGIIPERFPPGSIPGRVQWHKPDNLNANIMRHVEFELTNNKTNQTAIENLLSNGEMSQKDILETLLDDAVLTAEQKANGAEYRYKAEVKYSLLQMKVKGIVQSSFRNNRSYWELKPESTKKVNKEDYFIHQFISGYFGICSEVGGGNCVFGGDSANEDDYNYDYIKDVYDNWDGTLTYSGNKYGYQIAL